MARLIITIFFLFIIAGNLFSQPPVNRNELLSLLSSDQKLVRSAVDSSLCIIMQEYVLADSAGNEYGRNNNHYFGRSYTLGIITDSGIWASSEILIPWKDDKAALDKFNKPDLKPRLSKTSYKMLYGHAYRELANKKIIAGADNAAICYPLPDSVAYISSTRNPKDLNGWVILVSNKTMALDKDDNLFSIFVLKPKTLAGDSTKLYVLNNSVPEKENITGGAYFTCRFLLGHIVFYAAGIVKKDNTGWLIKPFSGNTAAEEKKEILTPLDKKKPANGIDASKEN